MALKVIDPNAHWIRFNLFDENDKLVKEKELDYLVRFDDGTEIRSQLKKGKDYLTGVPLSPFTLEIIPGDALNDKLAVLRKKLRAELATSITQVKADTARHEQDWAGKYINHRVSAFASYANGDVEGLRKGVQLILSRIGVRIV